MNENIESQRKRAHNETFEDSPEYQRILPKVMKEVYTQYATEKIAGLEADLKKQIEEPEHIFMLAYRNKIKEKIFYARQLISENKVEEAVERLYAIGDCHLLWGLQKAILKEKYGITWYVPAECYPNICFD